MVLRTGALATLSIGMWVAACTTASTEAPDGASAPPVSVVTPTCVSDPSAPDCTSAPAAEPLVVHVDPLWGRDERDGTRGAPVQSFLGVQRLATGPRTTVHLCGGKYYGPFVVTRSLDIAGGYDCSSWEPAKKDVTLEANTVGQPAFTVTGAGTHVTLSDVSLQAPAGADGATDPARAHSIGLFVADAQVDLVRVTIRPGRGGNARPADARLSNAFTGDPGGTAGRVCSSAIFSCTGSRKVCACPLFGTSIGGEGSRDANAAGQSGDATPLSLLAGGGTEVCLSPGVPCHAGANGLNGVSPGLAVATTSGAITSTGFSQLEPGAGPPGNPGGGGGGGAYAPDTKVGGGGGACGGCGGAGAPGGHNGGSSFAILAYHATLSLTDADLLAANGGQGSQGQDAESGSVGGLAENNDLHFENFGGYGGAGSGGSGGAGGAGGHSIAVAYAGAKPTFTRSTLGYSTAGTRAGGGRGGYAAPNPGAPRTLGNDGKYGPPGPVGLSLDAYSFGE